MHDTVLLNAFTLADPGALENIGCKIKLVDINENLTVDIEIYKKNISV